MPMACPKILSQRWDAATPLGLALDIRREGCYTSPSDGGH